MPEDTALRDVLGEELAQRAGADVERWLRSGAAGRGTKSGARLGARFTKVDHFELELDLPKGADRALGRAREVLSEEGEPPGIWVRVPPRRGRCLRSWPRAGGT